MTTALLSLPSDSRMAIKPICHTLGVAGFLVGLAWVAQACGINADAMAEATWVIMGAIIAGAGAGFLLIAHTDVV